MTGMRRVGIGAILAHLCVPFLAIAGLTTDEVIHKVEGHYNKARTLTLDFQEDYSLQGHRRPSETGKLTLRKQGKMRWDYVKPSGKVFVSDGKMVYLYTAADNKVEEIPLKDTKDMRAPLAFLLGHFDLKKEFRDFRLRQEGDAFWLTAGAKSAKAPYEQIEMMVGSEGVISKLNVIGRDQSRMAFDLSHEQVNPAIADGLFDFKIPPGAEVVKAVEYSGEGQ